MQMDHLHGGLIRLHLRTGARCLTTDLLKRRTWMIEDFQQPNGDFIKNYPEATRVEVITNNGREFVQYECSDVQVSLQDDGQTIKLFLFSTYK
jgi:hypothetical protein